MPHRSGCERTPHREVLRKDASPQRRKERKGGAEMGSNPLRPLCVLCVSAVKRPQNVFNYNSSEAVLTSAVP